MTSEIVSWIIVVTRKTTVVCDTRISDSDIAETLCNLVYYYVHIRLIYKKYQSDFHRLQSDVI